MRRTAIASIDCITFKVLGTADNRGDMPATTEPPPPSRNRSHMLKTYFNSILYSILRQEHFIRLPIQYVYNGEQPGSGWRPTHNHTRYSHSLISSFDCPFVNSKTRHGRVTTASPTQFCILRAHQPRTRPLRRHSNIHRKKDGKQRRTMKIENDHKILNIFSPFSLLPSFLRLPAMFNHRFFFK